jgi:superfamily II DNA or RNA helicase
MTVLEIKNIEQMKALTAWRDNNYKGTCYCVTGFGKTRLGVLAAGTFCSRDPSERWLIIVPTTNLKSQWEAEFVKWGFKEILNQIDIQCYQTTYKYSNEDYTGIIADEVHVGLSTEYKKVFENNMFSKIMCLTATIDDETKLDYLQTIAPIVYKMPLNKALELGLVSDYIMYNLAIPFTEAEQKEYGRINSMYSYYERMLGGKYTAFKTAGTILKDTSLYDKEYVVAATMYYDCVRKRKSLCYNSSNKIQVAKTILEDNKQVYSIVFSETIKPIQDLHELLKDTSICFHSDMSGVERKEALRRYTDRRTKIKQILSAKALNAGFNVENATLGIALSGTSKSLDRIQRVGRVLRLQEGKVAIFINMYTPGTQEEKWLKKSTESFNVEWITNINQINYGNIK